MLASFDVLATTALVIAGFAATGFVAGLVATVLLRASLTGVVAPAVVAGMAGVGIIFDMLNSLINGINSLYRLI